MSTTMKLKAADVQHGTVLLLRARTHGGQLTWVAATDPQAPTTIRARVATAPTVVLAASVGKKRHTRRLATFTIELMDGTGRRDLFEVGAGVSLPVETGDVLG